MSSAAIRSSMRRALSAFWAAAVLFLVVAFPAHMVVESKSGALLLQTLAAGIVGVAFAFRETLEQGVARSLAFFKHSTDEGASIRGVRVDA